MARRGPPRNRERSWENPYPREAASLQSWPATPSFHEETGTAMSNLMRTLFAGSFVLIGLSALARAAGPDASSGKEPFRPDPASVQRFGAGYRYPQAGWIVLHIEGEPYERGYQHGRLLAPEIARFVEALAAYRSPKAPADAWRTVRLAGQRPLPAQVRRRVPRRDEGHRRRRRSRRRHVRRSPDRPDRHRHRQLPTSRSTFLDGALDATATGLEADGSTSRPRARRSARAKATAAPSPPPGRPPPTARSSSATSRCGTSTTPTTTTSGSTSSPPRAIACSCRPIPAAS